MTRKQPLTDIERQAITIWELIQRTIRKYDYSIPNTSIKLIQKVTEKFLQNVKNTKYQVEDKWGVTFPDRIESHLIQEDDDSDSVYLTWLQFQFHAFIHQFCPEHDPEYIPNRQPYYNKMIEALSS